MKSLHVMYYRPFDGSMGLWIINEFLKLFKSPIPGFLSSQSGYHFFKIYTTTIPAASLFRNELHLFELLMVNRKPPCRRE